MKPEERIPMNGGLPLKQNPFAGLAGPQGGEPRAPAAAAPAAAPRGRKAPHNRGRVDIRRETAGRGGKTVTVVSGFTGIGLPEKEQLARKMQKACGAGGTVKDGRIEIQGDRREVVARILAEAGFRPVFAGG